MLRNPALRFHALFKNAVNVNKLARPSVYSSLRFMSSHSTETDAQFDQRYENFFNNPGLDGWDLRRGITDLWGHDLVPEPKIVTAILKACRRVDDLGLAIRVLEALKDKCGNRANEIYPWCIQEIKPTLIELGIPTLEELGYNKPELALQSVEDM